MATEVDSEMCWICLEEASENGSHKLMSPCKCPRKVHPQCLARWQLQQAGRHEERFCRFCNNELADWKCHLTPDELKSEVSKVQPIMVVYFEGQIHRIPVKQGPDGLTEFTTKIRELFRLPEDVDISLTFGCKEPMSGSHLKLEGMGAFDAAVHCASVAAAERQQKLKKSYSTGNLGSSPVANNVSQHVARSASNNSIPAPSAVTATDAAASPAAGLSAANAAQGRRHRFPGGEGQQQQQGGSDQQRPNTARSRSFTVGATPSNRSTGVEPPAAFRNILSMLGGGGSSTITPSAAVSSGQYAGQQHGVAVASGHGPNQVEAEFTGATGRPMSQASAHNGVLSPSPRGSPAQHRMYKKERLSLRNITELTDVPEVDETVAVGSFSGRFKLHLKAFSRKVARSLSFTHKDPDAGAAGSSISSYPLPSAASEDLMTPPESTSSSRAASMTLPSPRIINFAAPNGSATTTPRGMSPLPQASPRSLSSSPLPPVPHSAVRA